MMNSAAAVSRNGHEVEVSTKARRRRFTAEYKLKILREAELCRETGELSALLRREGLYSSSLATWRAARARGELTGLSPKRRGPGARQPDVRDQKIAELERDVRRLKARAERAEALVAVQKKVSELLGIPLDETDESR